MSYPSALAVFLVPLPLFLWHLGTTFANELSANWTALRTIVRWVFRFFAFYLELLILTVAQNVGKTFGAPAALQQILDNIVFVGSIGAWTTGIALLLWIGYVILRSIKEHLEASGHVLKLS